uniref:ABC transporter ATP-binding protein n=1 Tax=Schistosoma mansoni TaxID=6183 RepID=A0A5K4F9P5_SCHMA
MIVFEFCGVLGTGRFNPEEFTVVIDNTLFILPSFAFANYDVRLTDIVLSRTTVEENLLHYAEVF